MNLILLEAKDFISNTRVRITGRRHQHIKEYLAHNDGPLRVGLIGQEIGRGMLVDESSLGAELEVKFELAAPPPLPLKLLVALPRPKVLKRVVFNTTTLGVKELHFFNSFRVEKSYWQSEWTSAEALAEYCRLGLEQSVDTLMPKISFHRRFRPFVEDVTPQFTEGGQALVAHPWSQSSDYSTKQPATLAIGPEGGFIEFEIGLLKEAGFTLVDLGPRTLKVETAVTSLVSRWL